MSQLQLQVLPGIPMVEPGDELCPLILAALDRADVQLQDGDVLVLAQKIVSKSEGRYGYLNTVTVSEEAERLAREVDKDPRLVQLILDESTEVLRTRPGVIIVSHRLGYVHANAGIDKSNIESDEDNPRVLLLPLDSDASARRLREQLQQHTGATLAVIINDSAGRAWRNGTVGMAIGSAGFDPVVDLVGQRDLFDRPLEITEVAVADELAAAASFLMGQAAEAAPVVLVRGARLVPSSAGADKLVRDPSMDLFR